MTDLDHPVTSVSRQGARPRQIEIDCASDPSDLRPRPVRQCDPPVVGVVDPVEFATELAAEVDRRNLGGGNGVVGAISILEVPGLTHTHGHDFVFDLISDVTALIQDVLTPVDVFTVAEDGEILIIARAARLPTAIERIGQVCAAIARRRFGPAGDGVHLTPTAGIAALDDGADPTDVVHCAVHARELASDGRGLRVRRWEPSMSAKGPPEYGSDLVDDPGQREAAEPIATDPGAVRTPPRRRTNRSRSDGLPELSRSPTVADGEWTLGRLSRLQGRIEGSRDDTVIDQATGTERELESWRLARRAAGLIPTSAVSGEPSQRLRVGRSGGASPARLDESLISARVRLLLGRTSSPVAPPSVRPVEGAPDVLPRRRRAGMSGANH